MRDESEDVQSISQGEAPSKALRLLHVDEAVSQRCEVLLQSCGQLGQSEASVPGLCRGEVRPWQLLQERNADSGGGARPAQSGR